MKLYQFAGNFILVNRYMESEKKIYFSSRVQKNTGKFYFAETLKDSDFVNDTRRSPMTRMGTVFGINHQGMVIPI